MSAYKRLDRAFLNAPTLPLAPDTRYVLMSDCHRGTGSFSDNFLKNQHLYFAALQFYYENGFTYIELGDGDELWENRSYDLIKSIHNDVFWLLSQYYSEDRLFLLYGNHDMVKKYNNFSKKYCCTYPDSTCKEAELFPNVTFYEGLILKNMYGGRNFYLTHGHQADFLNSVLWKAARFLVRYLWKPLEQLGFADPTSAAKNYTRKEKTERILSGWAAINDCILITGHTHRPMLDQSSLYYNTGSCVHPRCITCIELTGEAARLVKWSVSSRPDRTLYVKREILV